MLNIKIHKSMLKTILILLFLVGISHNSIVNANASNRDITKETIELEVKQIEDRLKPIREIVHNDVSFFADRRFIKSQIKNLIENLDTAKDQIDSYEDSNDEEREIIIVDLLFYLYESEELINSIEDYFLENLEFSYKTSLNI